MTMTTITKVECPEMTPYPRNGNVGTQRVACRWQVTVNGRAVGLFATQREANQIAQDFQPKRQAR